MILLDTSVLSRVFRRRRPGPDESRLESLVGSLMASDVPLAIPGVVLQETLSGVRSEKQFAELERRLLAAFRVVHPATTDHTEAARLRNRCLARGLNVSDTDCLIATLAISTGHELFALDADFEAIAKHAPLKLYRPAARG